MVDSVERLYKHCKDQGLTAEIEEYEETVVDNDEGASIPAYRGLKVFIPAGRENQAFQIDEEECEELIKAKSRFYQYKLIRGYRAIWSLERKRIE